MQGICCKTYYLGGSVVSHKMEENIEKSVFQF